MNHHIKRSIHRVVFDSDLEPTTLRQVARMFRLPERTILDALREERREELRRVSCRRIG